MKTDRPLLGIGLMLCFSAVAPLGDAVTKLLGELVPVAIFAFWRFALQGILLTPLVLRRPSSLWLTRRQWGLTVVRALCHMAGLAAMFTALRFLPLADAVAIAFVMPFLSLLLGKFVLHEEVGLRRILACCVGFVGVLLVIQPSFSEVGLNALWPLLVAVFFALFLLFGRQIAQEVDPIAIQMISGFIAAGLMLPVLFVGTYNNIPALSLFLPQGQTLWLLLLVGVLGTVAHLCMTWSLRFAPSATLAPLTYIEIPITTLVGFAIFGDLPNGLAALGIIITMAAGLYIIFRERATARLSQVAQT